MSHTIAIFPGSFDPFTRGHQALVDDALRIFDKVVIGIGNNVSKAGLLRIEARKQLIEDLYADNPRVEVRIYTGLTGDFARDQHSWLTGGNRTLTWILYVVVAILVVTAVSNGANLTDGLDGLVTGVSAPIVLVLGILAYLSGHIVYADYLNIMYIPGSGELVVFAAALAGALVGFLWYNSFPAQIFMGDTGSLSIGGIIAVFALCIRKELLLPLLCGIFLVESLSVMLQVSYFKYTKRKYGEGRRILLMSPLHHHYQKQGFFETKIVTRFWIVSLLLAAITLVTLKIR